MPTGTYAPSPRHQFFDTSGNPLSGGSLETYAAGLDTPLETYSNVGLSVANPTTITLNAAGVPQVSGTEVALFLTPGLSYKFIVKNSAGTTVFTRDYIGATPAATVDLDIAGTAGENLAAGSTVFLSDGSGGLTAGRWYRADADQAYSSSAAGMVGIVPASIDSGDSGSIRLAGRATGLSGLTAGVSYYVSATAGELTSTRPAYARLVGVADSTTSIILAPVAGAVAAQHAPQGRLTLTTAVPVTTADVTAATTLYYTPYRGNRVWLHTGSEWAEHLFTELSLALTGLTADTNFDVFLYNNAGTLTLELLAWTNATTRATALAMQDGLLVKSGATTRLYLGTIRITGTIGQTEDSAAKRYVWNCYHRVARYLSVIEGTNSWTYTTATYQQANAAAGNQVDLVVGVAEDALSLWVAGAAVTNGGNSPNVSVAIGQDGITKHARCVTQVANLAVGTTEYFGCSARLDLIPAIGRHYYTWLEQSEAVNTTTWLGDDGGTLFQTGITGRWAA